MTDDLQVIALDNLNLRHAGSEDAAITATIEQGAVIHVTGPTNTAGYVPVYVFGYKVGEELWNESLAGPNGRLDAVLYQGADFAPTGPFDFYGRTPGELHGFVAVHWTIPANQVKRNPL